MTWAVLGLLAGNAVLALLWRLAVSQKDVALKEYRHAVRELTAEREHAADLRVLVARKEKSIADLEIELAKTDPTKLLDRIFSGLSATSSDYED